MLYAIVAVLALIIDQTVKYWVTTGIELNAGAVTVIPGVLSFVNYHNYGAAFGILQNARWLFVALAVVFVAAVTFAISRKIIRQPLGRWSAVLVMSGALGNCIDRVMNGYVVDMFRFDFVNFAIFNVADIFITVCGVLFCIYIIFGSDFRGEKGKGSDKGPKKRAAAPIPEEPPRPRREPSPAPAPKSEPAPAPKAPPAPRVRESSGEEFSLEEILAEFSGDER